MADLNPEQLRILEDLIDGFERLSTRARTVGDVMEQSLGKTFQKRISSAADAAADLAKAQTAAALSTVKNMSKRDREAAIESAGKQAANRVQREYNENIQRSVGALEEMGQAVVKLSKSIYAAEQGQKKYAEAVDTVVTALGTLAFFMGGPLTKAISTAVMGLSKFFTASTDLSDALYKGYQDISRFGAATGEGMNGVYDLMRSMNLSTEQLGQLNQLIGENAESLALFRGSVAAGAQSMGAIRKEINTSGLRREFFALGMNTQEINEAMGGFINVFGTMGLLQNKTTREATTSLRRYITEVDLVTKLTGATRKEQEAAAQQAMAIEQFNAKIAELRAKGDKASLDEAHNLTMTFGALNKINPQLAAGFAQMATGFIGPGSVGAYMASNGKAFEAATAAGMHWTERVRQMTQGAREFMDPNTGLGHTMRSFGILNQTTGMLVANMDKSSIFSAEFAEKLKNAKTEQERQLLIEDELLKNQIKTSEADLNSMGSMQDFIRLGVNPATVALAGLARVAEAITGFLPKTGAQATGAAAAGAVGAGAGAVKGAALGTAIMPGLGTAIGGALGGIIGGAGGFFAGKAAVQGAESLMGKKPEEVLDFKGESGSRESFDRLDPELQKRIIAAGSQYLAATGKKLEINSAFRTREKQEELYKKFLSGAIENPVAPPGSSSHEKGLAVDIQNYRDPQAISALNGQGLFQTVANDPMHFSRMPGYNAGGIAVGPRSGYNAVLHGTEAVVPLPNGRTIPVEMSGMQVNMDRQLGIMGEQLVKLDQLVSAIREQTSISQRILQVSQA